MGTIYAVAQTQYFDRVIIGIPTDPIDINRVVGRSLAAGTKNYASQDSIAIGRGNHSVSWGGSVGHSNTTRTFCFATGFNNKVNEGTSFRSSFAAGNFNFISADQSFASGLGNDVIGDYAGAIGAYLINNENESVVVGAYNEVKTDLQFSVGIGDSSGRSNALEVYKDGSVMINEPQGDIPMGIYGE